VDRFPELSIGPAFATARFPLYQYLMVSTQTSFTSERIAELARRASSGGFSKY